MQSTIFAAAQSELQSWVEVQVASLPGLKLSDRNTGVRLQSLSGDAGFRRYSRLNSVPPALAVHAPTDTEDSRAFVAIGRCLREQGLAAPRIYAVDFKRGFLLLEDFGEQLLCSVLSDDNVDQHYRASMEAMLRLQSCGSNSLPVGDGGAEYRLPVYDRARLHTEMSLLHEWFIPGLLQVDIDATEQGLLDSVYRKLEDSALQQPQVWVHRDFHSRNLVFRPGQAPGVIDFQDAVLGPLTYDLASLLRDCYVRWPATRVYEWVEQYRHLAMREGLLDEQVSAQQFEGWFDWMGLQRHIKVLGIFARLWLRDGKPGYLRDLPLVLRYTLEVAEKYPEFEGFSHLLRRRLLPHCERQSWYRDIATAGDRQ